MNTQPRQVDADPQTDIICHCKSITRADIVVAADAFGGDVGAICHATGAGRVCGGCVPRIGQIVGKDLMRDAVLVARTALDDHHTCYRFTIDAPIPRGSACRDALFEFTIGGRRHERSYTLTEIDAQARAVTITVRREANGIVSRWLSDKAKVGESVRISDPFGGFMAPSGHSPVFLAAGIGITPAVAWMRADTTPTRILWWVRGDTAPGLVEHVRALADETSNDLQIFDTSADAHRPAGEAALGVLRGLTGPDCDHPHLCGPQGFLDEMVTGLDRLGWGKAQRHVASFIYAPGQGADGPAADLHKLEQFDIGKEAVQAPSFHLRAAD
ncbi:MAG: (2Fe-2S)-binding protein, partial [Pseudomonadota bacterium]